MALFMTTRYLKYTLNKRNKFLYKNINSYHKNRF